MRTAGSLRGKPRGEAGGTHESPGVQIQVGSLKGERTLANTEPPSITRPRGQRGCQPLGTARAGVGVPSSHQPLCFVTCRAGRGSRGGRAVRAGRGRAPRGGMRQEQRGMLSTGMSLEVPPCPAPGRGSKAPCEKVPGATEPSWPCPRCPGTQKFPPLVKAAFTVGKLGVFLWSKEKHPGEGLGCRRAW